LPETLDLNARPSSGGAGLFSPTSSASPEETSITNPLAITRDTLARDVYRQLGMKFANRRTGKP
jgi:hypothetical protein